MGWWSPLSNIMQREWSNVRRETISIVVKWDSVRYNGRANASPSSSARCLPRERWREFGTMKDQASKTHSTNKTEPLVTRNAMEIVSSAPCRTLCIHTNIAPRDRYCAHSRAIAWGRSKDLKGSFCHDNWWTNVRPRYCILTIRASSKRTQVKKNILDGKEKCILLY